MWALSAKRQIASNLVTSDPGIPTVIVLVPISPLTPLLTAVAISQTLPMASSNLQAIFNASMKEYEKKTKNDLLAHPLMAQLQTCNSPADILVILRTQVQQFEQSTSSDDKLTRWLNPTVNVLYAFSSALGAGVGLVNYIPTILLRSNL